MISSGNTSGPIKGSIIIDMKTGKVLDSQFSQNNNLSRIKNTLYNYLKKDLKSVMEFDFEF